MFIKKVHETWKLYSSISTNSVTLIFKVFYDGKKKLLES